jgi:hypothetical protein
MFIRIGSTVFTEASFRRLVFHEDGTATLYLADMLRVADGEVSVASESREIALSMELAIEADRFFSADRHDCGLEIRVVKEAAMVLSRPTGPPDQSGCEMTREMVQIGRYAIDKSSADSVTEMLSRILFEETAHDKDSCIHLAQRLLVGMTNCNEHAELAWILENAYEIEDLPPSSVPIPYQSRA